MPMPPNAEPKPFFWIALQDAPQRTAPVFHKAFRGWTGRLDIAIEVRSDYLYVGSGQIDLVRINGREQARYAFTRRDGKLVIPATSIKGAVRAVFEAITNSCVSQRSRGERVGSAAHQACGLVRKGKERQAHLCTACRVFGTTGYRGRVYFSDAEPVDEVKTTTIRISDLWPPKRTKGRKFYENKRFSYEGLDLTPMRNTRFLEVVPRGAKFRTTLHFEILSEAELGALMHALGLNLRRGGQQRVMVVFAFPLKLGGAKPRCLGGVRFRPTRLHIIASPHQSWIEGLMRANQEQEELIPSLASWLMNTSLIDQTAWKTFLKKAQSRTDEPCPREVY